MSVINYKIDDSLKSLIGNLGNENRDKAAGVYFANTILHDDQLRAAYESNWIARKIVDIPAEDALRKWRTWGTEDSRKIEAEERRLNVRRKVLEAAQKGRLYGGAAVYIGTDQDPETPLETDVGLGGVKYLTVMTRRELQAGQLEQDPFSEYYSQPMDYTIGTQGQNAVIHPSRLILFHGDEKADPWLSQGVNYGWGNSALQATIDQIKQAGGTFANVASLIFEASIDVIGIPDLMSDVGGCDYEKNLLKRFALAAQGKGINGTLILDAAETYHRHAASFSQLPEIMEAFAMYCAAAADIPATRFLGRSPGGLNSTGEGDMKNYHDRLQAMQELEYGPAMELFDRCLVQSAIGSDPDDIEYQWNPFEQMSEQQLAEIGKTTAETLKSLYDLDAFTGEELREIAIHKLAESQAFPHIEQVIEETVSLLESTEPDNEPELPEPSDD